MIVGTAGHIDHGKTALVRALTGVDTDRLPEERRRGITIELGFAPLELPGLGTVGIVDVPGHEAFVRTMVAGATGVDLGLLVVAADEGVMPQTREHLAILTLLAVHAGIIVITKCDLAEPDWIELVRDELRHLVSETPLRDAPIVETSARDGRGIAELKGEIARLLGTIAAPGTNDLFRLPIDRAFSVKGTGTVVTGTAWSGRLTPSSDVRLFPADRPVRVRALQSHGRSVQEVGSGARVAVALAGVDVADVPRGSVLVSEGPWVPTTRFHAEVALQADVGALRPREWLQLHVGTSEVPARVVTVPGVAGSAGAFIARVVTEAPLVLRAGDRFVLRRSQPLSTVGGGRVTDPAPAHRRSRPSAGWNPNPVDRLTDALHQVGAEGLFRSASPSRIGVDFGVAASLLDATPGVARVGDRAILSSILEDAQEAVVNEVLSYHDINPIDEGVPLSRLRTSGHRHAPVVDVAVDRLLAGRRLELSDGVLRRPGWKPRISPDTEATKSWLLARLRAARMEPPSLSELGTERSGVDLVPIVRLLERAGGVVAVETDRYYATEAVENALGQLSVVMRGGGLFSPAQLREVLAVSRKYLMPFLEYCDRRRITERRGDGRVWLGARGR
ncbi:MAG: selenocysteine-specific translation elongation factor [Gemmatimonadaceae bacterium]